MKKQEEVPMHYVISKLSYESQQLYKSLYLIFGTCAIILMWNIIKKELFHENI